MCAGAELHTTHHPNSNPAVAVQSVAICTPKCTNAWSSDTHRRCVLAAGESDAAHHAALEDMADDCDTICFLDSGATLEQFKEACNPIFEGEACPDACRYASAYAHASVWSHNVVGARNALYPRCACSCTDWIVKTGSHNLVALWLVLPTSVWVSNLALLHTPVLCTASCGSLRTHACSAWNGGSPGTIQ